MVQAWNCRQIGLLVVGAVFSSTLETAACAQNAADNLVREYYAWAPCVTPTSAYRMARLNPQLPIAILNSARPERDRSAAFHCIVGAQIPGYKTIIVQALRDSSAQIRASAVHCLPEALEEEALVNQLVRMFDDPSHFVSHASANVLGRCQSKAALEPLLKLAENDSADIRSGAVTSLMKWKDEDVRMRLRGLSKSPNIAIAGIVAAGLAQDPNESANLDAIHMYLREELLRPNTSVSTYLIYVLGRRGDKESAAVLEAAVKHDNQRVQESATKALAELGKRL